MIISLWISRLARLAMEIVAVKPPRGGLTATIMDEIKIQRNNPKFGLPYEFRTTAVKGKHTMEIFEEIGEWLKGAESYFIQNFGTKKRWPKNTKTKKDFQNMSWRDLKY